jgi:hypothetical protein
MPYLQSDWVTRVRNTATAGCAGVEVVQEFAYTFTGAELVAGDKIELGILPAYNTITGGGLMCSNGTIAGDVGLMSGEVGSKDAARTIGAEIFAAKKVTAVTAIDPITLVSALTIAPADQDRSIGFKVTTGATPAKGDKLRLLLKYAAP